MLLQVLPPKLRSGTIWQYTSTAGLLGILETGGLWVSSARTLNDSGEIEYGAARMHERWAARRSDFPDAEVIEELLAEGALSRRQDLFVACASTEGDSLSQFRAYGSYAVGLRADIPLRVRRDRSGEEAFGFSWPSDVEADLTADNGWRPVLYDRDEQDALIDAFLEHVARKVASNVASGRTTVTEDDEAADDTAFEREVFASQFIAVAAHLKHEAFRDEKEVRLFAQLSLSNPAVKVRAGRLGLTPFFVAEPNPGPDAESELDSVLTEVRIGPGLLDPRAAMDGLKMGLQKFKLSALATQLEIPLR
ncbi:DUF2971 domain-containing protein [Curtobacterium sp. MCBD17_008]|uniref:DUF2971 domain-containing protein n=1 Tax=Curtobacterium sp. MCBD17_008 TaxID=2175656 RepID=UPI0011B39362|nr:DUF2971 domain-containing protein [Curtobacterium sp. MCBD17_008]